MQKKTLTCMRVRNKDVQNTNKPHAKKHAKKCKKTHLYESVQQRCAKYKQTTCKKNMQRNEKKNSLVLECATKMCKIQTNHMQKKHAKKCKKNSLV